MYNWLYKWYCYTDEDIKNAENQVGFLEDRIAQIKANPKQSEEDKLIKIKKMELSIMAIRYTYCL